MPLLVVNVSDNDQDSASDWLWSLGATAIHERNDFDHPTLVAGFADDDAALHARSVLIDRWSVRFELDPDDDEWRDEWLRYLEPISIGRLYVYPPWFNDEPDPARIGIAIDPGRAFGSGHHPSTRLALAALDATIEGDDHVLDVGSGTGILSIASVALGAAHAVGIDIDHDVIETATANAEHNGMGDRSTFGTTPLRGLDRDRTFDVVVANMTAATQLPLVADMMTRSERHLVLSGLLIDQQDRIVEAVGTAPDRVWTDDGWACLRFGMEVTS